MERLTVDCIAQHLKVFHQQAIEERAADFGEPCVDCPHKMKACRLDWLSNMNPLFIQTGIQIRLDLPVPPDIKDNSDGHPLELVDKLLLKDSRKHPFSSLELCPDMQRSDS